MGRSEQKERRWGATERNDRLARGRGGERGRSGSLMAQVAGVVSRRRVAGHRFRARPMASAGHRGGVPRRGRAELPRVAALLLLAAATGGKPKTRPREGLSGFQRIPNFCLLNPSSRSRGRKADTKRRARREPSARLGERSLRPARSWPSLAKPASAADVTAPSLRQLETLLSWLDWRR